MAYKPNKPAVSASYLSVIFEALSTLGLSPAEALEMRADCGISELLMDSPEAFLSVQQYEDLISSAIQFSKDPHLGLYVGQFFEVGTHGELSYAALGMPTIWECLKLGEKFARLRSPMLKVQLDFEQQDAVINFDTDAFTGEVYRFVIEGGICSYYAMLNLAFDNHPPPASISVRYSNPLGKTLNERKYQTHFDKKIEFGCQKNEIRLPRHAVEAKLHSANLSIAKELEGKINELLISLETSSLSDQASQLISSSVAFMPSQQTIAEHLNMSTRTLRRKLQQEGKSFQAIANDARRELAAGYLLNTPWNIEEIAYVLGFSSASHFSNTFKLWVGVSPKYFRDAQKQNPQEKGSRK